MTDIQIRKTGRAGRITLDRPQALNAVTLDMVRALGAALPAFAADPDIALLVIDATGEKAFSAGGDIQDIYAALVAGDPQVARRFWREEYRLNAAIARFPKPVVSLMHGFTMGGGVGVGCHASHRVVGESSRIAMPECGLGLVPDVGGTLLCARAPGHLGEYIGLSGHRMTAADAIAAGFADHVIPQEAWPDLVSRLEASGDAALVAEAAQPPGDSALLARRTQIDAAYGLPDLAAIREALAPDDRKALDRGAPLAQAAAITLIRTARAHDSIEQALTAEYRFAHRIAAHGDFQEGIRAAVIDKDRTPQWRNSQPPSEAEVAEFLAPLGPEELRFD